jgi:predicted RNase H-like HicB family nuclease
VIAPTVRLGQLCDVDGPAVRSVHLEAPAMITESVQAAMRRATYELMGNDEGFYARIPDCPGVWANQDTLEAAREELQSVLEDWLLIGIWNHDPIPVIDGMDLNANPVPAEQEVA